jgi:hypothetical protein
MLCKSVQRQEKQVTVTYIKISSQMIEEGKTERPCSEKQVP